MSDEEMAILKDPRHVEHLLLSPLVILIKAEMREEQILLDSHRDDIPAPT